MADNLNDAAPWDEDDVADLRWFVDTSTIEQAATFLCRSLDLVIAKADELGLQYKSERAP